FANPVGPGWANPAVGSFEDPRLKGRDGKPYGPLPRAWAQYKGLYHFGNQVILSYIVGDAAILEMPAYEMLPASKDQTGGKVVFSRTLDVGRSAHDLLMRVAPHGTAAALVAAGAVSLSEQENYTVLRIPAAATPIAIKVLAGDCDNDLLQAYARSAS